MLDGLLPPGWEMQRTSDILLKDDPRLRRFPTMADKMHCVVFVVDALNDMPPTDLLKNTFHRFRTEANKRGLGVLVALTKIDQADTTLDANPEKYPQSEQILENVDQLVVSLQKQKREHKNGLWSVDKCSVFSLQTELGIEPNEVFPFKSYDGEFDKTVAIDSIALSVLRNALRKANGFFAYQLRIENDQKGSLVRMFFFSFWGGKFCFANFFFSFFLFSTFSFDLRHQGQRPILHPPSSPRPQSSREKVCLSFEHHQQLHQHTN